MILRSFFLLPFVIPAPLRLIHPHSPPPLSVFPPLCLCSFPPCPSILPSPHHPSPGPYQSSGASSTTEHASDAIWAKLACERNNGRRKERVGRWDPDRWGNGSEDGNKFFFKRRKTKKRYGSMSTWRRPLFFNRSLHPHRSSPSLLQNSGAPKRAAQPTASTLRPRSVARVGHDAMKDRDA